MSRYRWVMKSTGQPMIKEPMNTSAPGAGEVLVMSLYTTPVTRPPRVAPVWWRRHP